jgi:asparagine N-glycosylation enzyme membrane subunit Stt3
LEGAHDAWRWLGREELFQLQVEESKPLFLTRAGWSGRVAELRLSRFVYLFPFALVWMAWESRKRPHRSAWLLVIGWSLVLALLTLLQRRFFNSFSVVLALVMGWSLVRAHGVLVAGRLGFSPGRAGAALGVALLAAFLVAPVFQAYRLPLLNQIEAFGGAGITAHRHVGRRRVLVAGAAWLRQNTPPTSGFFDAKVEPEYGVLAHWSAGHIIVYVAQRPTVVGNFGDDLGPENFAASLAYFEATEKEASAILDRLRVRYVLVETLPPKRDDEYPASAMLRRLSQDTGAELERHRLVYEYPLPKGAPEGSRSRLRIFEHVPLGERAQGSRF